MRREKRRGEEISRDATKGGVKIKKIKINEIKIGWERLHISSIPFNTQRTDCHLLSAVQVSDRTSLLLLIE
jgi:hypothetical protein